MYYKVNSYQNVYYIVLTALKKRQFFKAVFVVAKFTNLLVEIIIAHIMLPVKYYAHKILLFVINYKKGVRELGTLDKICALLKDKGIKQKELTDYLGVTRNNFSNWKSGSNSSYMKYLPQIAEFLGVPIGYLTDEQGKDEDVIKFAIFGTNDVSDEDLQQVKEFAKYILNSKKSNLK